MAVFDLFSKRNLTSPPQVQSDTLPPKLRGQLCHILRDAIGVWADPPRWQPVYLSQYPANEAWDEISSAVAREHGLGRLSPNAPNPMVDCFATILGDDFKLAVDVVELSLRYIDRGVRGYSDHARQYSYARLTPDDAISEFNTRCRENGFGLQYLDGRLVPAASPHIHDEVVKPALTLLQDENFRGPQEEFLAAFQKLREGDHKGAIVESGKAFESVMRAICDRRGWQYDKNATAKSLVNVLVTSGLIPLSLQTQFAHFRELLESGVPTLRNKSAAHGQGIVPVAVPRELAEYTLNLTATNLVLLMGLARRP